MSPSALQDPCGLSNKPKAERPYTLATDQFGVSYRLYTKDKIGELVAQVKKELKARAMVEGLYNFTFQVPEPKVQVVSIVRVGDKKVVGYRINTQRFMLRHVEVQSR